MKTLIHLLKLFLMFTGALYVGESLGWVPCGSILLSLTKGLGTIVEWVS